MSAQRLRLTIKFILALCSLVYELVLAQALSAFLDNTILRYSVTIGLYMCSMGIGALAVEGGRAQRPQHTLLKLESFLTLVGGLAVIFLYMADVIAGQLAVFVFGHVLIVAIGFLTGFELPLLLAMPDVSVERGDDHRLIAADYAGGTIGALLFAFVFYPYFGLIVTALFMGILNAGAGILLFWQERATLPALPRRWLIILSVEALLLIVLLFAARPLTVVLTQMYLR